jgi:hypothetical protein
VGIEVDRLAQQRLSLDLFLQTRGRDPKRGHDFALEDRISVTRVYQIHEGGKFFLGEQGVRQSRQEIGLVPPRSRVARASRSADAASPSRR